MCHGTCVHAGSWASWLRGSQKRLLREIPAFETTQQLQAELDAAATANTTGCSVSSAGAPPPLPAYRRLAIQTAIPSSAAVSYSHCLGGPGLEGLVRARAVRQAGGGRGDGGAADNRPGQLLVPKPSGMPLTGCGSGSAVGVLAGMHAVVGIATAGQHHADMWSASTAEGGSPAGGGGVKRLRTALRFVA